MRRERLKLRARPRCAVTVLAMGLLVLALARCEGPSLPQRARGVVIAVEARSLARADRVTVRTSDGRELSFQVDPSVNWTPGHLREHMAQGEPVVVEFTRRAEGLVALRIEDG